MVDLGIGMVTILRFSGLRNGMVLDGSDILDSHMVSLHSLMTQLSLNLNSYYQLQKALQDLQKSISRILKHLKQQGPVRQVHNSN